MDCPSNIRFVIQLLFGELITYLQTGISCRILNGFKLINFCSIDKQQII